MPLGTPVTPPDDLALWMLALVDAEGRATRLEGPFGREVPPEVVSASSGEVLAIGLTEPALLALDVDIDLERVADGKRVLAPVADEGCIDGSRRDGWWRGRVPADTLTAYRFEAGALAPAEAPELEPTLELPVSPVRCAAWDRELRYFGDGPVVPAGFQPSGLPEERPDKPGGFTHLHHLERLDEDRVVAASPYALYLFHRDRPLADVPEDRLPIETLFPVAARADPNDIPSIALYEGETVYVAVRESVTQRPSAFGALLEVSITGAGIGRVRTATVVNEGMRAVLADPERGLIYATGEGGSFFAMEPGGAVRRWPVAQAILEDVRFTGFERSPLLLMGEREMWLGDGRTGRFERVELGTVSPSAFDLRDGVLTAIQSIQTLISYDVAQRRWSQPSSPLRFPAAVEACTTPGPCGYLRAFERARGLSLDPIHRPLIVLQECHGAVLIRPDGCITTISTPDGSQLLSVELDGQRILAGSAAGGLFEGTVP